jgi:hypothetical protein
VKWKKRKREKKKIKEEEADIKHNELLTNN